MNRNLKILLLLFALLLFGYWLLEKKPWTKNNSTADSFAVKDTGAITRIFLANKKGARITLDRQSNNQWLVNNSFVADDIKVNLLLSTLHDMQIKMPVPPSMHNTAIGILASNSVKTEIYTGEELIKTIYVGSETPDKTGTFMIQEGETEASIIHIPGFVGFLTPRFFLAPIKWRSKLLFNLEPSAIQSVNIEYPQNPEASFTFMQPYYSQSKSLLNKDGAAMPADTQRVKLWIHSFKDLYVEGYYEDSTFTPAERDSLYQLTPYLQMHVKEVNGKEHHIVLYNKPVGKDTKDRYEADGTARNIDPEKFYARINEIPQIASVQEYALRRILLKAQDVMQK